MRCNSRVTGCSSAGNSSRLPWRLHDARPPAGGYDMDSQPRFLQGVYPFDGRGLLKPFLLDEELTYVVPAGLQAQLVYFRGGNSSSELVYVVLMRDGDVMRYFPLGAKADSHVPL